MVEALASGKPVIAFGKGGSREIVTPGCGLLYDTATEDCLNDALREFERRDVSFDAAAIRRRAFHFSEQAFQAGISRIVDRSMRSQHDPPAHDTDDLDHPAFPDGTAQYQRSSALM
jgi:glycosyltransferase involved in cell wall biosynthesis